MVIKIKNNVFRMLNKTLKWNEQLLVKEQIALIGQTTKKL